MTMKGHILKPQNNFHVSLQPWHRIRFLGVRSSFKAIYSSPLVHSFNPLSRQSQGVTPFSFKNLCLHIGIVDLSVKCFYSDNWEN